MKADIKVQWIEELRSGEIEQGKGCLKSDLDGMMRLCCLGVLCELAVKAKIIPAPIRLNNGMFGYGAGQADSILPAEVREWANIDSHGHLAVAATVGSSARKAFDLCDLNDSGLTFKEIADLIEADKTGLTLQFATGR